MSSHFSIICMDCEFESPFFPASPGCPRCGSEWREAAYEYETVKHSLPLNLPNRPFNLWRYRELLPIRSPNPDLQMGEGGTPLIRAVNLGMMLGCPHIYIKDERQSPTISFKDRQAAVSIAALKEAGIGEAVIASTGNVAISYSAYAARAGIKLWAFVTSLVPPIKMREAAIYGSQVIKVTGNYDQAKQVAAEFARQRGIYLDRGVRTITNVEAMKTIAFEISEQLTSIFGPNTMDKDINGNYQTPSPLRSPDWYFQSVSGGLGPVGVTKGFDELHKIGLTSKFPKLANIQAEGCSPMVNAWHNRLTIAEPERNPRTHIGTLATGDPGRTYTILRERMLERNGGTFESVTDAEAFRAMHIVAKMEGISVEPATAVAFAGLIKMVRLGEIKPTDVVVINCTGHTVPVEQSVLGENWSKDIEIPEDYSDASTPEEGLLSALNKVTAERYPSILIADDHPHVRRLIRRILSTQGQYTLFETEDGRSTVKTIQKEKPDLVILDLMMPEMDGFSVLDAIKSSPQTSSIPVIVVTAKELTEQEKERLSGQIESLMQKGDLVSEELIEEVQSLVN